MRLGLCILLGSALAAQAPVEERKENGQIEGRVADLASGRPLRRAQVVLRADAEGVAPLGASTDDEGRFRFYALRAGRYALTAQRDGYLPSPVPVIVLLQQDRTVSDVTLRLSPGGVIAGRVKYNDAEPAVGVLVQLYREYYYRGRHGYSVAGRARTNDRGDYRMFELAPGAYYLAALHSPPVAAAGVREQPRLDANGRELPPESVVTTFYPATSKLVEALPVKLAVASEVTGADIFLTTARTLRIRGRVISGLSGRLLRGATILVRRPGPSGEASIETAVAVRPEPEGGFEISGLTPGTYQLAVNASEQNRRLTARLPLALGEASLDNFEILVMPDRQVRGALRVEGALRPAQFTVSLEPRSETAQNVTASVDRDGSFSAALIPGEIYDVFLRNPPEDAYLKAARLGGVDVLARGLSDPGELPPALELTVAANGGQVRGQVTFGQARVASGVTVMLVPDPPEARLSCYQAVAADEYGLFVFRGVCPGDYVAVAWVEEPPCDLYHPQAAPVCRPHGASVKVAEGGQAAALIRLPPPP